MTAPTMLPNVPAKHADFIPYVQSHPHKPLPELLEPYKQFDAKIREVFAQEPDHPALADGYLNIAPVFNGHEKEVKIRARDPKSQSPEENERYIMPLDDAHRRPDGSPAIVETLDEFKHNFGIFCEQSLVDMDWTNVVAAGSSVVTSLLPVPAKYKESKRVLRQYYHEMLAPASDVDLFLYGLSEEEAINKIIQIEQRAKDTILTEVTTIRTKNTITIVSQYPTRHIQIVLRLYRSVAEILTGFDVDCSCAAYDGKQVYAAPRALAAYMTQLNTIDLTRRSPSYESRLSKYSHRGFEVYWPLLDRSRIDPTIFERNFGRTVGLARLLVLERLPSKTEREVYMDERRRERGRPAINRHWQRHRELKDDIKAEHDDEIAEWVEQDDVSDYHTFTIPYGQRYSAKKIEKLLYMKDILLNAEWNQKKDREVHLHRHPAFFGYAEDVIHDCCGYCPKPVTPEEIEVAEEESKVYVSGKLSFIKDDPGRQAIGSFNPINDGDWTEMAYVGNTARLCQAIVDQDLEHVQDWLSQEGSDPNCRDYTGRTPLHLAVMCSSPEIVKALIDHDARLVARLADGRTALHLAAARGSVEIVRLIMQRSEQNEEEEAKKEDNRRRMRKLDGKSTPDKSDLSDVSGAKGDVNDDVSMADADEWADGEEKGSNEEERDSDEEESDNDGKESDVDMLDEAHSGTTGSFVKVESGGQDANDNFPQEDEDEPDVYDVNVLAWDLQCSPLHLAILHGNIDVVKELVQNFGADVLLPVKLYRLDKKPRGAILTLVLSLSLPLEKAKLMAKTLLELGASSAQADMKRITALHYISSKKPELLDLLFEIDEPAAKRAINHLADLSPSLYRESVESALMTAIDKQNKFAAAKLLEKGANPFIHFKDWVETIKTRRYGLLSDTKKNKERFQQNLEQPIILAIENELPDIALRLIEMGTDVNTLTTSGWSNVISRYKAAGAKTVLDMVREKISHLREYLGENVAKEPKLRLAEGRNYLHGFQKDTYPYFVATKQIQDAEEQDKSLIESYEKKKKAQEEQKGVNEKKKAISDMATNFAELERVLLSKGAKTFRQLHPKLYEKPRKYIYSYESSTSPFEVDLSFSLNPLEETEREAYLKLFQAVWDNDIETVKSLTLSSWGNGNKPLVLSVEDSIGCSPFGIAVMRGHRDLARALVEIAYAQYEPEPEDAEEDDDDYEDEESSENSEIKVHATAVDHKFTIENIGEVSMKATSHTSPVSFMSEMFPVRHYMKLFSPQGASSTYGTDDKKAEMDDFLGMETFAITVNDMALFSFLVDLRIKWTEQTHEESDEPPMAISFPYSDFVRAIEYGRVEFLDYMIRRGGAGMELASLVKRSGIQYREKPKYYQGLSVHGKKRSDWVAAARGIKRDRVAHTSPPLLKAALQGNLRSVEWFLSDTPYRRYLDFAEANKDHKYVSHLNKQAGGFERVLREWYNARRGLALHCAVKMCESEESIKLVSYLVDIMPESLETKSVDGWTPLAVAFRHGSLEAAKILIKTGADQTTRDHEGCNILHHLFSISTREGGASAWPPFLDLIDKRLLSSLLTERCSERPGSLTPIARQLRYGYLYPSTFRFLLEYALPTENKHLELLDGTGDTPLHFLVKEKRQDLLEIVLEYRPDLLLRENSVGRTPYEIAQDLYMSSNVQDAPDIGISRYRYNRSLTERPEKQFAADYEDDTVTAETVWTVCKDKLESLRAEGCNDKRILVSLNEANEVAKRLATSKWYNPSADKAEHDQDEDEDEDVKLGDEVRGSAGRL